MTRIAWLLNLDADDELRDPRSYTRSRPTAKRMREYLKRASALAGPGDVIVDDGVVPETPGDVFLGQAWCPTPRALAVLHKAGAVPPAAPSLEVLRRTNNRRFAADLGQHLDGACFVTNIEDLGTCLARRASESTHSIWVIKTAFGFAGRGLKRLHLPVREAASRRWLVAALAAGDGVQVEPWVERTADFGLHGWIDPSGGVRLGQPTVQTCDARGQWLESRPATRPDLDSEERHELSATAERAADALRAAGYFGPFGIDAYRWRDARGRDRFNPCSEINARYSMGWPVGMRGFRPPIVR